MLCVRNAMDESGVHFAMDVHGDEAIPAVFLAGFEGIPNWTEAQGSKFARYAAALARRTPDFQTQLGYGIAGAGQANLSMSTNQLANRFGAVSFTLEMRFGRRLTARTISRDAVGYEQIPAPGKANKHVDDQSPIASHRVLHALNPFKDHDANPDAEFGWGAERSKALAHSCLEVLAEVIDTI